MTVQRKGNMGFEYKHNWASWHIHTNPRMYIPTLTYNHVHIFKGNTQHNICDYMIFHSSISKMGYVSQIKTFRKKERMGFGKKYFK